MAIGKQFIDLFFRVETKKHLDYGARNKRINISF
jgi:hypothetical protein